MTTVGRNDPCPCGSGRKYKQCCFGKTDTPAVAFTREERDTAWERLARFSGLPDGSTLVDLFLGREGDRLRTGERRYLERMRPSHDVLVARVVLGEDGLPVVDGHAYAAGDRDRAVARAPQGRAPRVRAPVPGTRPGPGLQARGADALPRVARSRRAPAIQRSSSRMMAPTSGSRRLIAPRPRPRPARSSPGFRVRSRSSLDALFA
jgi:hypothetical protein